MDIIPYFWFCKSRWGLDVRLCSLLHTDVTLPFPNASQSPLQRESATAHYINRAIGTPGVELSQTACTLSFGSVLLIKIILKQMSLWPDVSYPNLWRSWPDLRLHSVSLEIKLRCRYLHCVYLNWNWISPIPGFPVIPQIFRAFLAKIWDFPSQYN